MYSVTIYTYGHFDRWSFWRNTVQSSRIYLLYQTKLIRFYKLHTYSTRERAFLIFTQLNPRSIYSYIVEVSRSGWWFGLVCVCLGWKVFKWWVDPRISFAGVREIERETSDLEVVYGDDILLITSIDLGWFLNFPFLGRWSLLNACFWLFFLLRDRFRWWWWIWWGKLPIGLRNHRRRVQVRFMSWSNQWMRMVVYC